MASLTSEEEPLLTLMAINKSVFALFRKTIKLGFMGREKESLP